MVHHKCLVSDLKSCWETWNFTTFNCFGAVCNLECVTHKIIDQQKWSQKPCNTQTKKWMIILLKPQQVSVIVVSIIFAGDS